MTLSRDALCLLNLGFSGDANVAFYCSRQLKQTAVFLKTVELLQIIQMHFLHLFIFSWKFYTDCSRRNISFYIYCEERGIWYINPLAGKIFILSYTAIHHNLMIFTIAESCKKAKKISIAGGQRGGRKREYRDHIKNQSWNSQGFNWGKSMCFGCSILSFNPTLQYIGHQQPIQFKMLLF